MKEYWKSLNWINKPLVSTINSIEYKYLLKNYNFLLNTDKNIKILEVWPWVWYFTQFLINNGYKNIDLVELSKDFFYEQKKSFNSYENIKCYNLSIIDFLKENNKKYDIIISRQVVEHLNEKELLEYFKLTSLKLKKWWKIISETINSQNFIYSNFLRYIDITHKLSFSSNMIKQIYNLNYNEKDNCIILPIKQLNILDFIFNKFRKFKFDVKLNLQSTCRLDNKVKKNNIFWLIFSQIIRDFAILTSQGLSKLYFYKRAYKNIWTEFILFIFEKWKK